MSHHLIPPLPAPVWPGAILYEALATRLPLWKFGSQGRVCGEANLEHAVAAAQVDSRFLGPAAGMAYWLWQQHPFDVPALETFLALERLSPFLAPGGRQQLAMLPKLGAVLSSLRRQWVEAWAQGNMDACRKALDAAPLPPPLEYLGQRLRWQLALYTDPETLIAADPQSQAAGLFGWWLAVARGFALREQGDYIAAAQALLPAWRAMPWHTNLACVLDDLLHRPKTAGITPETLAMSQSTAVCLYSWNKARPLRQALSALAEADLGDAQVLLLDNGSTDATLAVMEDFARRAPNPVDILSLPANIGAPAARNWLLAQPQVEALRYVAFLDDDAIVPPHWLWSLLDTAARHPKAGIIGCQITGPGAPYPLQAADFHLLAPALCPSGFSDLTERIHLLDNGMEEPALGLYAYERPAATVTGCCHLLTRRSLDAVGRFDLAFSPTQFDDAERDLRSSLAGLPVVYAGHLRVRHLQHSSLSQAKTTFQEARIRANKAAMELRFADAAVQQLVNADSRQTLDHLSSVLNRLQGT